MRMAREFSKLSDLFNYIEKNVQEVLENEVADVAKDTMQAATQEYVYNAYTPSGKNPYQRRGISGGLLSTENIVVEKIDNTTISIKNITKGNTNYSGSTNEEIDGIIVRGRGYTWMHSSIYRLQPYPRDFYGQTVRKLKQTGEHIDIFKKGMRKRGIKVE